MLDDQRWRTNKRGKTLPDRATILGLISATKSKAGPAVECLIEGRVYEIGKAMSDNHFTSVHTKPNDKFRPEWNSAIYPRRWNINTDQNYDLPKPES